MSTMQIADVFGYHKVYLAQIFKETTGNTLAATIEGVRINKAGALLKEGCFSVDAVAKMVGYSSADVFRRAFRRVMGVTPNQYR